MIVKSTSLINQATKYFVKLAGIPIVGILLFSVLQQSNPYVKLPWGDRGIFLYGGLTIFGGKPVYTGIWDNKGPLIYWINAFGLWLMNGSQWGVWFLQILSLAISCLLLYLILRSIMSHTYSTLGVFFFLLALNRTLSGGNLTEEYSLPFTLFALWLFIRPNPKSRFLFDALIGACLAVSFFLRANNVGIQISVILSIFIIEITQRNSSRLLIRAFSIFCGFAILTFSISIHFLVQGTFMEMINASIIYNFVYSGTGIVNLIGSIKTGISNYGYLFWLSLIGFLTILEQIIKKKGGNKLIRLLVFIIIFPLELILASISSRTYTHYFIPLAPTIGILIAIAANNYIAKIFHPNLLSYLNKYSPAAWAIALVAVAYFQRQDLRVYKNLTANLLMGNSFVAMEQKADVSNYVIQTTDENDYVLTWGGDGGINYLAKRWFPTPYITYPFIDSEVSRNLSAQFFVDIKANPPVLIIDPRKQHPDRLIAIDPVERKEQLEKGKGSRGAPPKNLDEVLDYINSNYSKEITIDGFDIYRLNTIP